MKKLTTKKKVALTALTLMAPGIIIISSSYTDVSHPVEAKQIITSNTTNPVKKKLPNIKILATVAPLRERVLLRLKPPAIRQVS